MVGRKTEKSRFKRSVKKITDKMREIRHWSIEDRIAQPFYPESGIEIINSLLLD